MPRITPRFDVQTVAAVAGITVIALSLLPPVVRSLRKAAGTLIADLAKVGKKVEDGKDLGSKVDGDPQYEYDVIIVGGGTAGCALASRISEDQNIRVLLLEAGKSGLTVPASRIPAAYGTIMRSEHCWDFWTEPQPNAGGKKRYWPRAKLLGGCSSINAMMYQLGSPSDFDEWAKIGGKGASAWRWSEFQKYFLKFEKFVPHKLYPNVETNKHGVSGKVEVGFFGHFTKIASTFITACEAVGIPRTHDFNTTAGPIGVTKIMTYIDSKGCRVSSESAYLTPEVLERPNLKVAISASATRILFDTSGPVTRAIGVEFARDGSGPRFRARAAKEVILSTGAVHTPQILKLSGVGPAKELSALGIPVVRDLPGVGEHLMDHPAVNIRFRCKDGEALNFLKPSNLKETSQALLALAQFKATGKGPLTTNIGEAVAFVKSNDPKLFPVETYGQIEDSMSGPEAPDLELFISPLAWTEHGLGTVPAGSLVTLTEYLLRPTSLGSITLRSNDPFDAPIIDPRYLTTQHDVDVLVRGVKLMLNIAQAEPLASLLVLDDDPALDHNTHKLNDNELADLVRERTETVYHPTSTARMAPLEDGGVVDTQLRVHGIPNLRIVDTSIYPKIVSGHTAAACIAAAELASDLVKAAVRS
ncbi:alcohol oxidase [Rickenella mellea]|uniref:Alcohol oxidase n=1 Tax=Rickenella mellea TaxID=50990 RepID=A0A4Y7QEF6_9AGAM|nr:alcohol oxidase [Rickenella mellea]